MQGVLAIITGAELGLLAAASALVGSIVGSCRSRYRRRCRPQKRIEIKVQRIDRPYRGRWRE